MDSETTTNRKGFLKRAGLAIAGVFAVSSHARTRSDRSDRSRGTQVASQSTAPRAMSRVQTAKGAVARNTTTTTTNRA